jgi:hypothetical protein
MSTGIVLSTLAPPARIGRRNDLYGLTHVLSHQHQPVYGQRTPKTYGCANATWYIASDGVVDLHRGGHVPSDESSPAPPLVVTDFAREPLP